MHPDPVAYWDSVITESRSPAPGPPSRLSLSYIPVHSGYSPRLGLVRTCHAATCTRQTQRGSYMAKALLWSSMPREVVRMHFAREPRENDRPVTYVCVRTYVYVSFLSFFPLHYWVSRVSRLLALSRSCMTGGHECATELALIRIVHFIA